MLANNIKSALATLFVLLFINPTQAEKHHDEGHDESHNSSSEAHVHGIAELLIVLDEQELQVELHSPSINLLGFEHQAKNAEQEAKIERMKVTLANADELFQFNSGACQLNDQKIDLGHLVAEDSTHGKEHAEEEIHDEDHSENKHHEEEHLTEDHDDLKSHSDIEAEYRYNCKNADKIHSLETTISNEFPSIESLEVQWIINGRQGAVVLEKEQREVVFK